MNDSPSLNYAEITKTIGELIARPSGNDQTRTAYMIIRAASLQIAQRAGHKDAARRLYGLADELATQ